MALGLDAFACSFGYGASKVKIPFKSVILINLVCSFLLAIGLFFGAAVGTLLPESTADWLAFAILLSLGIFKIFDSTIKKVIRNRKGIATEVKFSLFNVEFLLKIYANPAEADVDDSKVLSPREAAPLAVALGIDGLSVGFGVGVAAGVAGTLLLVGLSLISGIFAVMLGCLLGNKIAKRTSLDLSWLSGAILIIIALLGVIL